jgi:hypothetical protein
VNIKKDSTTAVPRKWAFYVVKMYTCFMRLPVTVPISSPVPNNVGNIYFSAAVFEADE